MWYPVHGASAWRNPLYLGMLTFALTLLLALLFAWGLRALDAADDPWLMALILSTTSLGLVVPVLKERDLVGQRLDRHCWFRQ